MGRPLPTPGRAENVVIVHSGWGLDADGKPVWLVTDFQVLTVRREAPDRVA